MTDATDVRASTRSRRTMASALLVISAYLLGTVLTPVLLPWLPGRPLALKGLWTGIGLCIVAGIGSWQLGSEWLSRLDAAALTLLVLAIASFMAMKFTGSTTYTSLSGVRREMRIAGPLQAMGSVLGIVLWIAGRFV